MSALLQTHFRPGDRVIVDDRDVAGHCRAPWYLRGQTGVVAEILGTFRDPQRLAYGKPGWPKQPLYKVRFKQTDLWPAYKGAAHDQLDADIAENWLRSAPQSTVRERKAKRP